MRIWSIHPQYLDSKGLVALWRETLLAKKVLEGKTSGYRNHPQLNRFKESKDPLGRINQYLSAVYEEACSRGYEFSKEKINWKFKPSTLSVTRGQMRYETMHLLDKLKIRDKTKYLEVKQLRHLKPHPLFKTKSGGIEKWEITKNNTLAP